jgi:cytochrome c556
VGNQGELAMKTFAALLTLTLLAGCKTSAPAETVQQLMKDKVDPASKIYFDAVRYISDENGSRDIVPQTDAEWETVRQAAVDLQDYGKLLQTDAYTEGRNPDWTKFSQAMVDVGKQAEQAATDKNVDKVFEISGTIYNVCSACHQAYPPPVPPASSTPAPSPGV